MKQCSSSLQAFQDPQRLWLEDGWKQELLFFLIAAALHQVYYGGGSSTMYHWGNWADGLVSRCTLGHSPDRSYWVGVKQPQVPLPVQLHFSAPYLPNHLTRLPQNRTLPSSGWKKTTTLNSLAVVPLLQIVTRWWCHFLFCSTSFVL